MSGVRVIDGLLKLDFEGLGSAAESTWSRLTGTGILAQEYNRGLTPIDSYHSSTRDKSADEEVRIRPVGEALDQNYITSSQLGTTHFRTSWKEPRK